MPLGEAAQRLPLDGAELAESLATGTGDPDDAVRAFEERMWERAGKGAKITTAGLGRLVSPDPAEALALFGQVRPARRDGGTRPECRVGGALTPRGRRPPRTRRR